MSIEAMKPIAWLEPEWGEAICPEVGYEIKMTDDHPRDLCWIPLYAHPPQRTWLGLSDEEFDFLVPYCHNEFDLNDYKEFARDIEAKLKEKNA